MTIVLLPDSDRGRQPVEACVDTAGLVNRHSWCLPSATVETVCIDIHGALRYT